MVWGTESYGIQGKDSVKSPAVEFQLRLSGTHAHFRFTWDRNLVGINSELGMGTDVALELRLREGGLSLWQRNLEGKRIPGAAASVALMSLSMWGIFRNSLPDLDALQHHTAQHTPSSSPD
jgi:hypothetical protein